jgi:hypothetical protein
MQIGPCRCFAVKSRIGHTWGSPRMGSIRRFLQYLLPKGFYRISHYRLLANGGCTENIAKARALLAVLPAA